MNNLFISIASFSLICAACLPPAWAADVTVDTSTVLCPDFMGFGCHGFYYLNCGFNTSRGVGTADRTLNNERIRKMRMDVCRVFWAHKWWEPTEGVQTPDDENIQDQVRFFTLLKESGCQVNLVPWGDWWSYPSWCVDGERRLPKAEKRDAANRSFVDYIQYLRETKGLDNVSQVTFMNEPDNNPATAPTVPEYQAMALQLDAELENRGLRGKISYIGIDGSSWYAAKSGEWFYDVAHSAQGLEYCDATAQHTYGYKLDLSTVFGNVPPMSLWIDSRKNEIGEKPWTVQEFNIYNTDPDAGTWGPAPGSDFFEHGLYVADFALECVNRGASSVVFWCLSDQILDYAGNQQHYGLWKYKTDGWEPRPAFYSWSLVTRYTAANSQVYALDGLPSGLKGAAFISPRKKMTVFILNRTASDQTLNMDLGRPVPTSFRHYLYASDTVPTATQGMLDACESLIYDPSHRMPFVSRANSFSVLSSLNPDAGDDEPVQVPAAHAAGLFSMVAGIFAGVFHYGCAKPSGCI